MAPYANAERLEELVWDRVSRLLLHPQELRAELERRRSADSPTRAGLQKDLERARARFEEVPAGMDRLVEDYG